jgi:hypothetical protein
MSDTSSLTELARMVGGSNVTSEYELVRRRAIVGIARGRPIKTPRRSVGELLGAVLALSARTRRMVLPYMTVDLDVFSPGGDRAVRLVFAPRD